MVDKKKQFSILATLLVISSNFIPFVVCHGIIPADVSKLNQWITENVKEFAAQNAANGQNGSGLDAVLATAEASPQVITVNQQGPGDFKTITDAVKSIPPENTKRVIIKIGPGEYKEKITIDPSRKFVTFFGDPSIPKIMYDASAAQYGTVNSSTVAVEGDYFMAVNIEFVVSFLSFKYTIFSLNSSFPCDNSIFIFVTFNIVSEFVSTAGCKKIRSTGSGLASNRRQGSVP